MVDFANLDGLEVDGKTSKPFEFEMANKIIYKVWFFPATEDNVDFAEAQLLLAQKKGRDANRKGKVNIQKEMKRARREDMALFAKTCAEKWEGPVDIKGNKVPFSKENVFQFLTKIPHRYQDALRAWIRRSHNFLPDVESKEQEDQDFELDDLDDILDLDDLDAILESEKSEDEEEDLGKSSEKSSSGSAITDETKDK